SEVGTMVVSEHTAPDDADDDERSQLFISPHTKDFGVVELDESVNLGPGTYSGPLQPDKAVSPVQAKESGVICTYGVSTGKELCAPTAPSGVRGGFYALVSPNGGKPGDSGGPAYTKD